jgi:hypothetical protein
VAGRPKARRPDLGQLLPEDLRDTWPLLDLYDEAVGQDLAAAYILGDE